MLARCADLLASTAKASFITCTRPPGTETSWEQQGTRRRVRTQARSFGTGNFVPMPQRVYPLGAFPALQRREFLLLAGYWRRGAFCSTPSREIDGTEAVLLGN